MTILHIDSSVLGDNSVSRTLSAAIVARLRRDNADAQIRYLDLGSTPLAHLDGAVLSQTAAQEAARGAAALEEFLAADVIVIGAPMYNFQISSQLKSWIDRVMVAGKTFRYTASGPQELAGGKKVMVAIARGGVYPQGSPSEFVEPYLRHVFGFMGISDVIFVRAEGLSLSPEHRAKSLNEALATVAQPITLAA